MAEGRSLTCAVHIVVAAAGLCQLVPWDERGWGSVVVYAKAVANALI
jgi:hypothetical protein